MDSTERYALLKRAGKLAYEKPVRNSIELGIDLRRRPARREKVEQKRRTRRYAPGTY